MLHKNSDDNKYKYVIIIVKNDDDEEEDDDDDEDDEDGDDDDDDDDFLKVKNYPVQFRSFKVGIDCRPSSTHVCLPTMDGE